MLLLIFQVGHAINEDERITEKANGTISVARQGFIRYLCLFLTFTNRVKDIIL